jgi:DNA-binding Xre family transcriptional regulator
MVAPLSLDAKLQPWLAAVGIGSWQALSDRTQIGLKRIRQLRHGNWESWRIEDLRRLAGVLQVSLEELLSTLSAVDLPIAELDAERAWQLAAFQQLESFLTYWPAAAYRVEQGGELAAAQLLPLVKPIGQLLASWQIKAIGQVGDLVAFDPRQHQSTAGSIEAGAMVKVRYPGYRQVDRLLRRAQVEKVE